MGPVYQITDHHHRIYKAVCQIVRAALWFVIIATKDKMYSLTKISILLGLVAAVCCQYGQSGGGRDGEYQQNYENYNRAPPPQILTHKQALNHDGNFKYLFTSENGLAQGESIAPDGSRNGGYSYVDPTGRKISVKYTAGKEGFRILEADHLPKAPQPVAPLPVPQQQAAYQPQPYNLQGRHDDGQYRPELYQPKPSAQQYYNTLATAQPRYTAPLVARPTPISNELGEKEPEYNDEPGKPNSFGTGYIFEFSG